jgi:hypothetical protein
VAFALEARALTEVASLKLTWMEALKDRLANVGELASELASGEFDNVAFGSGGHQDVPRSSSLPGGDAPAGDAPAGDTPRATRASLARQGSMVGDGTVTEVSDDPLFCSANAVRASMPRRLATLAAAQPEVEVERVWTTLCVIAYLETLNVCWLATDGELYPDDERTIIDTAREWVEGHAKLHPQLAAALADGALVKVSRRTVGSWHRAWERRVGELRRTDGVRKHLSISHVHRSCCELMRAFCTKHGTFSVFLSAPLDGLQRWQSAFLLRTRARRVPLLQRSICARAADTHPPRSVDDIDHAHHRAAAREHLDVRGIDDAHNALGFRSMTDACSAFLFQVLR